MDKDTNKKYDHKVYLIKILAADLDLTKPNFKMTLDSLQAQISELKSMLNLDRPTQDSQVTRQGE